MIIDPKSNVPIFRQIVEQTCEAIEAGIYRPGEALPSLRALAVEIRVNPNTIQRAYEELERNGLIESRRGLGVFVVDPKTRPARGTNERQVASQFRDAVNAALDQDFSPMRIRELFETALNSALVKARKRR